MNERDWLIRPMTLDDLDTVHALEQRLFPEDAWPRDMFDAELAQPQTRTYWVAEASGETIGYAGLMFVAPIADVQTIAVIPEREGQGIGGALLGGMIAEARRLGAEDLMLEVRADNPRAQSLYQRFGFRQIHVRRGYYKGGVDALIMQLPLAGPTEGAGATNS